MKKIFIFLSASVMLYFLLFLYLDFSAVQKYTGYNRYLNQDIDAMVVFFGDFDADGNIDRESLRRLSFAVELHRKHIVRNIIFVGGCRPSKKVCGSALMAEKAVGMGIKPSEIFFDVTSRDTVQNWKEAEKIIIGKNFKKVILVSSPFHLMRIKNMIEIRSDIEAFYAGYEENSISPPKSFMESFSDYNYNVLSIITYLILPSGIYQVTISKLRD